MAELIINISQIRQNIVALDQFFSSRGFTWTLVMKVLAGYKDYYPLLLNGLPLNALVGLADSRIDHLITLNEFPSRFSTWQIRPPVLQNAEKIVDVVDVSCNSSLQTLEALNKAAAARRKIHKVILMLELGENREGFLPDDLLDAFPKIKKLNNLEILGLGANLGCLHGVEPTQERLEPLLRVKSKFERDYGIKIPMISGGSSINLPFLLSRSYSPLINHFRIGEAVFFGTTPYDGSVFPGLLKDNFVFRSSILQVSMKDFAPLYPLVPSAIGEKLEPPEDVEKGIQGVIDFGLLDTDPQNLTPLRPGIKIVGSTSDMTTVYDPQGIIKVGEKIDFIPDYMGVAKLMVSQTVVKSIC